MKFIVSSSALLKQLQQINGVIGSNNVLPILEDFLFEIEKNMKSLEKQAKQTEKYFGIKDEYKKFSILITLTQKCQNIYGCMKELPNILPIYFR